MYAKLTLAVAEDDDMLAARVEADCKQLAKEIIALSEYSRTARGEDATKQRTADAAC
jgi:hypothetical protein